VANGDGGLDLSPQITTNHGMPERSRKRPRDPNELAKFVVDIATGEREDTKTPDDGKNPAAVALGRLGGLKGGKARAEKLSKKRRADIARRAARARWKSNDG
jgi:hypothetical protein